MIKGAKGVLKAAKGAVKTAKNVVREKLTRRPRAVMRLGSQFELPYETTSPAKSKTKTNTNISAGWENPWYTPRNSRGNKNLYAEPQITPQDMGHSKVTPYVDIGTQQSSSHYLNVAPVRRSDGGYIAVAGATDHNAKYLNVAPHSRVEYLNVADKKGRMSVGEEDYMDLAPKDGGTYVNVSGVPKDGGTYVNVSSAPKDGGTYVNVTGGKHGDYMNVPGAAESPYARLNKNGVYSEIPSATQYNKLKRRAGPVYAEPANTKKNNSTSHYAEAAPIKPRTKQNLAAHNASEQLKLRQQQYNMVKHLPYSDVRVKIASKYGPGFDIKKLDLGEFMAVQSQTPDGKPALTTHIRLQSENGTKKDIEIKAFPEVQNELARMFGTEIKPFRSGGRQYMEGVNQLVRLMNSTDTAEYSDGLKLQLLTAMGPENYTKLCNHLLDSTYNYSKVWAGASEEKIKKDRHTQMKLFFPKTKSEFAKAASAVAGVFGVRKGRNAAVVSSRRRNKGSGTTGMNIIRLQREAQTSGSSREKFKKLQQILRNRSQQSQQSQFMTSGN